MREEFIPVDRILNGHTTDYEWSVAESKAPWAAILIPVPGGFMAFQTYSMFQQWNESQ